MFDEEDSGTGINFDDTGFKSHPGRGDMAVEILFDFAEQDILEVFILSFFDGVVDLFFFGMAEAVPGGGGVEVDDFKFSGLEKMEVKTFSGIAAHAGGVVRFLEIEDEEGGLREVVPFKGDVSMKVFVTGQGTVGSGNQDKDYRVKQEKK